MNLKDTRLQNIKLIREIFEQGGICRLNDLVLRTGLSQVSCSNVIDDLISEGVVCELPRQGCASRGRPVRRFEVNKNYRLCAEITLECENLKCAFPTSLHYRIVNILGEECAKGVEDGGKDIRPEKLFTLVKTLQKKHRTIRSVVISFPGPTANGKIGAGGDPHFDTFVGLDMKAEIRARFNLPCEIANDMNLAALGYYHEHASSLPETFAYLGQQPNSCPGCGLVINGQILEGASGFAGEVKYLDVGNQKDLMIRLASRAERKKLAVRMICSLTAVLNPTQIVLAGETFCDPPFIRDIEKGCAAVLPQGVWPQLVVRDDWTDDVWKGLFAMSQTIDLESSPRQNCRATKKIAKQK